MFFEAALISINGVLSMNEVVRINVTLHGWLIKYFDYKQTEQVLVPKSVTLAELAEIIALPPESYIAFVDGHQVSNEDTLSDNDNLHFYPLVVGG